MEGSAGPAQASRRRSGSAAVPRLDSLIRPHLAVIIHWTMHRAAESGSANRNRCHVRRLPIGRAAPASPAPSTAATSCRASSGLEPLGSPIHRRARSHTPSPAGLRPAWPMRGSSHPAASMGAPLRRIACSASHGGSGTGPRPAESIARTGRTPDDPRIGKVATQAAVGRWDRPRAT